MLRRGVQRGWYRRASPLEVGRNSQLVDEMCVIEAAGFRDSDDLSAVRLGSTESIMRIDIVYAFSETRG